jgi:mono/diheme cytochrome c family protein
MKSILKFRTTFALLALLFGSFAFVSMTSLHINDWVVPAAYKTKANPQAGKADPDNVGKGLYKLHCKSCHGAEGFGDGDKASTLKTKMNDFTAAVFTKQTDGEIYYKSYIGREEMPNFEKKIKSETDRWLLVNYIRKLAK